MWRDARDTRRLAAEGPLPNLYAQLPAACQLTILLLFLFGLSLHNGLRYNWLWIAAFTELAFRFSGEAWDEAQDAWHDAEADPVDEREAENVGAADRLYAAAEGDA
jgi:hypothetical protein